MQAFMPRIPPTLGTPELPSIFAPDHPAPKRRRRWVWLALLAIVPIVASHLLVVALRWLPLPTSAVMLQSPTQPVQYRWVPSSQIAEVAGRAVIAAEDQRFREHGGLDFEAIEKALEYNQKSRRTRGASTISQQVAKNLFLWPRQSWLRKGLEVAYHGGRKVSLKTLRRRGETLRPWRSLATWYLWRSLDPLPVEY